MQQLFGNRSKAHQIRPPETKNAASNRVIILPILQSGHGFSKSFALDNFKISLPLGPASFEFLCVPLTNQI